MAKASKTRVLYSFGREDQLDVAGVRRLVDALSRLLDPADALAAAAPAGLSFVESRPLGGVWLLDGLWRQLGIDKIVASLVGARHREVDVAVGRICGLELEWDDRDQRGPSFVDFRRGVSCAPRGRPCRRGLHVRAVSTRC